MKAQVLLTVAALVAAGSAWAKAVPASIFNDNMVLQRDSKVPVWGRADPGERVTVAFAGQKVAATAGKDGFWKVELAPMPASAEGRVLSVNETAFKNVVVGEVWLCSGQSNMSMWMWYTPKVCQHGNRDNNGYLDAMLVDEPEIRGVNIPCVWSVREKELEKRQNWMVFAPGRLHSFSALAFHYAKILHDALKVPVGVIESAWGGTNIETWISPDGYRSVPAVAGLADRPVLAARPPNSKIELHKQARALWNAMIHPLVPYALRGAIWYQGESNRGQGLGYKNYLHALYNGWAKAFTRPDAAMPFYVVQIAPFDYGLKPEAPGASSCDIWEAEASFAKEIPNGGCAVIVDVGENDNIHPGDKRTVALRLAVHALNKTYGRKEIPCESPTLKEAKVEGGKVTLTFANVNRWLMHGTQPAHFEVADEQGIWHPAKATYRDGGEIVLASEGAPTGVRYMWNWCWKGKLKNEFGLPLGPFKRMLAPASAKKSDR